MKTKTEKTYSVYMHIFPNKKIYIGITSQNPLDRWDKGRGYKKQEYMFNAILKYGWDNIEHKVLFEDLTREEAEQKEVELISFYRSNKKGKGYNIENGGTNTGRLSEKQKETLRKARKERKTSEETKRLMSEKFTGTGNPFYNKHHKPETIEKIRQKKKGRKHTNEELKKMIKNSPLKKLVYQYDKNYNFINSFISKREAIRKSGIDMGKALTGKKQTAGGYIWSYKLIQEQETKRSSSDTETIS